jgi:F420-dependent oxidoreductase-like protein
VRIKTVARLNFGIAVAQHQPLAEIRRGWRDAEELGFDSGWVYDHFIGTPNVAEPFFEGWTLLTALLAEHSRIRGGTLVLGNSYRYPALLAKMAATLDVASEGRFEFGLGAGWYDGEYRALGIPFERPAVRLGALEEAVRVIRGLWTDDRSEFEGRYYRLQDAPCNPKPIQRPHPPIWVGGRGEQLTLRVVARAADGWNVPLMPIEAYRHKAGVLDRHCAEAGRDPGTVRRSTGFALIVRITEADVVAERRRREGLGVQEFRREIAGTPEQVTAALLPYLEAGVDTLLIEGYAPLDREGQELFIREVAPALRAQTNST